MRTERNLCVLINWSWRDGSGQRGHCFCRGLSSIHHAHLGVSQLPVTPTWGDLSSGLHQAHMQGWVDMHTWRNDFLFLCYLFVFCYFLEQTIGQRKMMQNSKASWYCAKSRLHTCELSITHTYSRQAWGSMPRIPVCERLRPGDQEFSVIADYTSSLRSSWLCEIPSQKEWRKHMWEAADGQCMDRERNRMNVWNEQTEDNAHSRTSVKCWSHSLRQHFINN